MKKLSRLLCLVLAVVMSVLTFVGCHEKDEIAFTIGESKFTSAMYSCVLYISASNARSAINTYAKENEIDTAAIDYTTFKFNDNGDVDPAGTYPYETFVRNETIKLLKQYATLDVWMKENNLKLDDDTLLNAQNNAAYQWYYGCTPYYYSYYANMGYDPSSLFTPAYIDLEKNGVAYPTYEKYYIYEATYDFYFMNLYGENGEKEIAKDDLNKNMSENYAMVDIITFSKKGSDNKELSDEKLNEIKALADKYAERLNNGEKFEDIYKEEQERLKKEEEAANDYTESSGSSTTSSGGASSAASSTASSTDSSASSSAAASSATSSDADKGYKPAEYVKLYGNKDTSFEDDMFDEIIKQEIGKAVVLEDKENSQYMLIVRRNMTDELYEEYWLDYLRKEITYSLKSDEYDASLNEYGKSLALTEDARATKPFGVDDIVFNTSSK